MSIRLEGYMQTTQQNAPLKRTMKTRHLIMLSLGGVIGTGLFFNTGYIISTTGAAGTLLAYLIGALVVWLVMQCLGELSVAMPETGAFHVYAARYLGPATGYTVAWLYWLTWTVALGSSFTAAGFCMQYWFPLVPVLGFVLCLVACVGLAFDPAQRIALWCGLPFVALCYGAYFLTQPRNAKQEPEHVAE